LGSRVGDRKHEVGAGDGAKEFVATARRDTARREGYPHDGWENIAGELLWVHNFHLCQVNNAKRLEIDLFYIWHICLGVGKLHNLPNKKCQTVGVALRKHLDGRKFGLSV